MKGKHLNFLIKSILYFTINFLIGDQIDFEFDGWDRQCYLFKPSCVPDEISEDFEPIPLVFMFHGLGGVGQDNYDWSSLAEDSCFIVAFPSGMYNTWNIGPEHINSHDIDDNSYIEALMDTILNDFPIDTNRIFGTGHSMGGALTNHLFCTSNKFTALGSSGGWQNWLYAPEGDYEHVCDPINNGYTLPMIHTHGMNDDVIPVEAAQMAILLSAVRNHCDDAFLLSHSEIWNQLEWPMDLNILHEMINDYFGTADTLHHDANIHRYEWSNGCHTEPSVEAIILPGAGHEWHHPYWNNAIHTNLVHWNFFRQFSKDKMGPALDSLVILVDDVITLNDDYTGTDIRIMAIDNYAVAQMKISFSGLINIEGFDLIIDFNSNSDNLVYLDTTITFESNIPSDNYETFQVSLFDFHHNEKVYDIEQLKDLDLYQQVGIINTLSNGSVGTKPSTYTLQQNYPNPFNPMTKINYSIPEKAFVSISVYDIHGRMLKTMVNQNQETGKYFIDWNSKNEHGLSVPAGMYFYTIKTKSFKQTKKMILLK